MEVLLISVGAITIIYVVALLIRKRYSIWKDMGALYEEPDIPYGNLKGVGKVEHISVRMQKLYRKYKGQGPFVGIYIFFKPAALLLDLELVKTIMIKDFNDFHDRGIYYNEKDDPLSAHMFNIHGKKWRLLRSKLSPTFTSGKMKMMFPSLIKVAQRLEVQLEKISKKDDELNIKTLMARFTTDVIGNVAFGIECNSLEDENSEFYRMGLQLFSNPRHNPTVDLLLGSFRDLGQKLGFKRLRDEVSNFFTKVVASTVDYRISNDVKRNDFMDLLIGLKQTDSDDKITFNELLAQAFVFFVAGFETSSSLMQFCLFELASNPDIQNKVRHHISEILAKHNGELSYEAMLDMSYLEQVLNETLRLHPPLSTLVREAGVDYNVPGSSFVFKKGAVMVIPVYAIHRDPDIYPNPEVFNPENFSDKNIKDRPSEAFLPFGAGPRNCIGARFGMMQARVGIITALQNFSFTLSSKTEIPIRIAPGNIVTNAVGGIWLKVDPVRK